MKSILENRPALATEVEKVAEVAGYLWQKGWAERNGGNITVNITEYVDDEIKAMPAISEVFPIGTVLPNLKGCYFYCKGTNMRMRDLARRPMENGSIIRILEDCASYVIIADTSSQLRSCHRTSAYTTTLSAKGRHIRHRYIPTQSNSSRCRTAKSS